MPEFHQAVYVISVAAELAGVHPQTLRIYERKGLVEPGRTQGGSRRYSEADIALLRRIQDLTNEGLNLAGVKRVLSSKQSWHASTTRWIVSALSSTRCVNGPPRTSTRFIGSTAVTWCRSTRRWSSTRTSSGAMSSAPRRSLRRCGTAVAVVLLAAGAVVPPPAAAQQRRVVVVGDSVILGAKAQLTSSLAGMGWAVTFDAAVSRSTAAGLDAIESHRGELTDSLVVSLGANDAGNTASFRQKVKAILDATANVPHVYWVTIREVRDYYGPANQAVREVAAGRPNVTVVDWHAATLGRTDLTARRRAAPEQCGSRSHGMGGHRRGGARGTAGGRGPGAPAAGSARDRSAADAGTAARAADDSGQGPRFPTPRRRPSMRRSRPLRAPRPPRPGPRRAEEVSTRRPLCNAARHGPPVQRRRTDPRRVC